ncbi:bacteriocin [Microvirga yunnanensis]|uniref:bacteriocin n=1 Tax=Microvirga yunnanensis TaxID=2953740 RepID=UPI0021C8641F|nr:bacteriocin [Microvirga sp. HBU67655]
MRELHEKELKQVSGGASTSNEGFDSNSGQGNLNNDNVRNNPGTVTESGPKGVLKNDNTDNPNYSISGPGQSNG